MGFKVDSNNEYPHTFILYTILYLYVEFVPIKCIYSCSEETICNHFSCLTKLASSNGYMVRVCLTGIKMFF